MTLGHQEPDRVPFDLSLTVDIYHRLREYLGLPPEPDKAIGLWTNVSASLDMIDAMGVDIIRVGLNPPSNWTPLSRDDGVILDEWGIGRAKIERVDGSFYYEIVHHPLKGATLESLEDYPWPNPYDPGRIDGLREKVQQLRDETDKAIMAGFSTPIWEGAWYLYGFENWLMDLSMKPEITAALLDKVCELATAFTCEGLESVGDLVDIVRLSGEDLGMQTGPMISVSMFDEIVKPRFERHWRTVKDLALSKNPDVKLMLHSCGSVRAFIPSWIRMGLDILDPIQPGAKDMEPERLKADFGNELVFHGGIDTQHTLPFGTESEVKDVVRHYIQALGVGGGYIVAPAHNVQNDVPPENLVAIRDAIEEFGYYPLLTN
jgi:uroporphyrinogen decarboxylase